LVTEWVTQKAEGRRMKDESGETSHPSSLILHPSKVAWLSLDENDNDPARFLAYFIAALQTIEANIGQGAFGMLQAPQAPAIEAVLTSLINDIVAIPDRVILTLDDYHLIESLPVHDALTFFLENLPAQLHLVIATREDPHLPLARLRARGQLTELRGADLRFSSTEAAEFLNQVMDLDLSVDDIAALETRTEGWIAGLQLAALSMQGHEDAARLIKSFTGSHRFVLDYLIEEVLEQQSEALQTFLLKSAILDRLTGKLCDALTGQDNGQATLESLEQANLFVIPLDNERRWYRYHHLFADLLRQRLRQTYLEQIPTLHGRASVWHEATGRPSESIRHALAAEDFQRAADLAELAWPAMSAGIQSITWLGWLKALPDEVVRVRPVLTVGYAWAFLNSGRLEEAEARLLDAERWLEPAAGMNERSEDPSAGMVVVDEEQFRALPVSLGTARAYHAQAIGDLAGTIKYTRRVLDILPEGDHPYREAATMLLGLAQYAGGELEAAHRNMSNGLAGLDPLDAITGAFVLANIKMAQGQLNAALSTYEQSLQLAKEHGEPMPLGTEDVYSGISELHRERGDLEAAAQDLLTGKKLGEKVDLPDWRHRWCIAQARLRQSQGDLDGALDLLHEAERLFVRTPVPEVRPIAAIKAQVWVRQGKLVEALGWVRARDLSADDDLNYIREYEHITLARVLMAQHKSKEVEGSIHEVLGLVGRLLRAAEEGGRTGSMITILVLQALVHESQGDISAALVSLERALTLAEPEGYLRIFVDEGPPMARLLYEALSHGIAPEYVQRLLVAFPMPEPEQKGSSLMRATESEWIEHLSKRETEVLQLISEGLTNQEIASRLYLSLNTVKVHTRNIYGKLGVHHRTSAVARARALGFLPSN
jgi:LuxR family maltose regulon positive regulatory protein